MEFAQKIREYTIEDIYTLPEGQRAELIDGNIYMMSPPKTQHQRLVQFLSKMIGIQCQPRLFAQIKEFGSKGILDCRSGKEPYYGILF